MSGEKVERVGISLEKGLLAQFDALISEQGYPNRSEAVRDLIRRRLAEKQLDDPAAWAVAAVCLVYDHHDGLLTHRIMTLQHNRYLETICTTHVHLDHDHCLETIILRGTVGEIRKLADALVSLKGVTLGRVNLLALADDSGHSHHHHNHHPHD